MAHLPKFLPLLFESPIQINNPKETTELFQANPEIETVHEYIVDIILTDSVNFNTRNIDVSLWPQELQYLVEMKSVPLIRSLWYSPTPNTKQKLSFEISIIFATRKIIAKTFRGFFDSQINVGSVDFSSDNLNQEAVQELIKTVVEDAKTQIEKEDREYLEREVKLVARLLTWEIPDQTIDLASVEAVIRQVAGGIYPDYKKFVWPTSEDARPIRNMFIQAMEAQGWKFNPDYEVFIR